MICIECGQRNIANLYSKYKSDYIKLTVCPSCSKICDKYIEYDSIILFLDILLLKKGAYRHLAYNLTETGLKNQPSTFFSKYRHLMKLSTLIILFEVYLTWATYEQDSHKKRIIEEILKQSVALQYTFFIVQTVLKNLVFNLVLQVLSREIWKVGKTREVHLPENLQCSYISSVLLTTVMVSGSIRLFRILMLIWPYDISITKLMFDCICVLNIIEALNIVTDLGYVSIVFIVLMSLAVQEGSVNFFNECVINLLQKY